MSSWFSSYGFADVLRNLLIGAYPLDGRDIELLSRMGVERVLNLVEDSEYRAGEREAVEQALAAHGITEERVSLTDFGGLPAETLEDTVATVNRWLDEDTRVYVHCRAGWQRSAAVAAAVVAVREDLDIDEALRFVQQRKPTADPLPHQREDLQRWWQARAAAEA
ncbi:MAG TPA: dual specificity protein phosphatase family protein [Solirubrobacteraceae bacterium]|nr:dual specificity protein phosphatase family protein [Solirubrobacteraceae bacterium]